MDDITKYLVNCIVLPPKLPQNGDGNKVGYEDHLIKLWLEGIQWWISLAGQADGNNEALRSFAQVTANIHATKHIVPEVLASALRNLQPGGGFATYIRKQNCGLLFHQQDASHVTLEMFEASAANTTIMSSSTMPLREFPGVALEVDADFLCCDQVRERLSQCLADLATQSVERFIPLVRKARKEVSEVRNTPSSRAVTGALLSALLPYGRIEPVISTIKKVRDEVCWNQALLPWRRPSLWTVLRVATQRWLEGSVGSERGWHIYKNVQLIILTQLCVSVIASKSFGDELFYIRAKLARRLDKLRSLNELNSDVDKFARSSLEKCNRFMSLRWKQIINEDSRLIRRCQQTDYQDTTLWLKNSTTSIKAKLAPVPVAEDSVYRGPSVSLARIDIVQDCHRLELFDFAPEGHDLFVSLYDFELQVEAMNCEASSQNCRTIQTMFNRYEQAAARLYACNADRESTRLLTLVELWVQLDRITLEIEPLVRLLDPALPKTFLSHLRLMDLKDLERVRKIEAYIASRSKTSTNKLLSPFVDHEMIEFANQYYINIMAGAHLREARTRIDRDTAQLLKQKQAEWKRQRERCDELEREAAGLSHEQEWDQWAYWKCRKRCHLCEVKRSISLLTIMPFEEPLPRHERSARWALFELLCPEEFHIWRDVTWELGNDLGRQGETDFKPVKISCELATYSGLKAYHSGRTTRLSLMSNKKSFSVAHYGKAQQVASSSLDKVCLPHGPEYSLYDSRSRVPTASTSSIIPILLRQYCGLLPQDERYAQSQTAIVGTQHTANDVVSSQSRCHYRMSLFEFHSFNILRSGELLQWLNIMIELACPSLEFAEDATNLLISQAALEIGTPAINNNVLRMSHDWFSDSWFCTKLLHLLLDRVKQIRSNWKELTHLRALLVLVLRLETLGSCLHDVVQESYQIRLLIRESSCEWTRQLKREISQSHTASKMSSLRNTKLSAALLCRATYTSADSLPDWGPYFECGFIVGNESPAVIADAPAKVRHDILHDWTNSCKIESRVIEACQAHPEQLSAAVGVLWADGERIQRWRSLDSPNTRWLWAQTEASVDRKQMQVHINVLTGELLVEGKSPDRLPKPYLKHPQYREIFGSRQFEILPSPITGMIFAAKTTEGDFHFAWENNDIQILRDNGERS